MPGESPTIDPDWREHIRRGPVEAMVRDLAVSVRQILLALARGAAAEQLLSAYPGLQLTDIRACLAYAAEVLKTASPPADTCTAEAQTIPPAAAPAKEEATEAEPLAPRIVPPDQLPTIAPGAAAGAPVAVHVPGYEILEELGRGGMGVVYKARAVRLDRIVALKMILAGEHAGHEMLDRFRREAQAAAQLSHAGIVQVYEVGEHDGRPYIVQEFVAGGSLTARLGEKPWPAAKAAELVEALARAVQIAHEHGIVHRDLKPENVLLTEEGRPKIADFGLAKRMDAVDGKTRTGAIMGTPSYMAPEQAGGRTREIGPAADVYALGAILYRLLTGRPPFQGADVLAVLMQVLEQEPEPVRSLNPKTPRDLETIALKCLRKEPGRRYESANAMAGDLRRFLDGEPIRGRRQWMVERGLRWVGRHPFATFVRVLTVLLVVAVALGVRPAGFHFVLPAVLAFTAGVRVRMKPWVLTTLALGTAVVVLCGMALLVSVVLGGQQDLYFWVNFWVVLQMGAFFLLAALPLGWAIAWVISERGLGRLAAATGIIALPASPILAYWALVLSIQVVPAAEEMRSGPNGQPISLGPSERMVADESYRQAAGQYGPLWCLVGAAYGVACAGIIRLVRWSLLGCDPLDAAIGAVGGSMVGFASALSIWMRSDALFFKSVGLGQAGQPGQPPSPISTLDYFDQVRFGQFRWYGTDPGAKLQWQLLAAGAFFVCVVVGAYLGGLSRWNPHRGPAAK